VDLAARFGEDAVFYDLHGIPTGVDFAAYLGSAWPNAA
jgi:hypothetical protein